VRVVRDDGRAIRDDERVTVVTSNFLAEGGDGLFAGSKLRTTFEEEPPIREAMVDELRHRGGALAGDDPRLIDPARPRLAYPGPRPVRCGSGDVGD
jgi:hypothetical protein